MNITQYLSGHSHVKLLISDTQIIIKHHFSCADKERRGKRRADTWALLVNIQKDSDKACLANYI